MSNTSGDQSEFDFWEFVSCSKCRMPFALDNGLATIPFWLTECGHVICNNHLNPDQSCCQCGTQGIQVAPLQRQMDPPMSEWFQSIPHGLNSIAYAAKFQLDVMASQVRYHRSKYQQLRQFVERLKRDLAELKKSNDGLQRENDQYRLRLGHHNTDNALNSNGKRPMVSAPSFDYGSRRPRTGSSPLSINAPIGPNRLTLVPGQQLPELSTFNQQEREQRPTSKRSLENNQQQRPISSRYLEQYAYAPQDESSKLHTPQLSSVQMAPRLFQRANNNQSDQNRRVEPSTNAKSVPPPSSSQFKLASSFMGTHARTLPAHRQANMGPPPTPQHVRSERANTAGNTNNEQVPNQPGSSRLSNLPPPRVNVNQQVAVPATPLQSSSSGARRFFPSGEQSIGVRNPSRSSNAGQSASGGQRTPFIPQGQHGRQSGFG